MRDTRLILLEGPPGAGKSTTGELLAERLCRRGVNARYLFGFAPDHPIQTRCERLARRVFGGEEVPSPDLARDDETVFTAPQWARLAASLAGGDEVLVVEGKYFQQCLEVPYLLGLAETELFELQCELVDAMAPARPALLYFDVGDVAAHRAAVVKERPPTWPDTLGGFFAIHPWAKARGLAGRDAFAAFYDAWAPIERELVERHGSPKLDLVEAHHDRDGAWTLIDAFLDPE